MERVYTWVGVGGGPNGSGGGVADWGDPRNWLYGEYYGPGLYAVDYSHVLANTRPATSAPGATDTVAFGFLGGQVLGGGSAARLVGSGDSLAISLADDTANGRTDVYSFGSVMLNDRMLVVNGAVLLSKETFIGYSAGLYLGDAGVAVDQWGRAYSADLGALTLQTPPVGGMSARIVTGMNAVEADTAVGNTTVHVGDPVFGQGQTVGGIYSAAGTPLHLDPLAAPGFLLQAPGGAAVPLAHSGNVWSIDLHVPLGATMPTFILGAANVGTGGALSYQFALAPAYKEWNAAPINTGAAAPLAAGQHSADIALGLFMNTPGLHGFSVVLHAWDDSAAGGHAALADQTFDIRITVDPPPPALHAVSVSAPEGSAFTLTAHLDYAPASPQTVQWRVVLPGGTTATPDDFVGGVLPSGTLAFSTMENTRTFTVPVGQDSRYEPDETFAVEFFNPTSGIVLADTRVFGTILNDDRAAPPPPPPPLHVSDAQIAAYEALAARMLQTLVATHGDLWHH